MAQRQKASSPNDLNLRPTRRHETTAISSGSQFQYEPLLTLYSFRLLKLLPGRSDEPIRCSLYHSKLSNEVKRYTALSYTWGPPQPTRYILLNGKRFWVRENLFRFLHTFRGDEAAFWVDAICINQADVFDRNHQVGIMNYIYSSAKRVYAWLGPASTELDYLFHFMSESDSPSHCWSKMRKKSAPPRQQYGIDQVRQCEYWGRIWIVQELLLARDVVFWSGGQAVSLALLKTLRQQPELLPHGTCASSVLDRVISGTSGELKPLVMSFSKLNCADPHDKIYALLGIVRLREETKQPFPVRYEEPMATLFARTMDFCRPARPFEFATSLASSLNMHSQQRQVGGDGKGSIENASLTMSFRSRGKVGSQTSVDPRLLPISREALTFKIASRKRNIAFFYDQQPSPGDLIFYLDRSYKWYGFSFVVSVSKEATTRPSRSASCKMYPGLLLDLELTDSIDACSSELSSVKRSLKNMSSFFDASNSSVAQDESGEKVLRVKTKVDALLELLRNDFQTPRGQSLESRTRRRARRS